MDPKLNGMDIRANTNEATRICDTVTGPGTFVGAFIGGPAAIPYFIWAGTTWQLSSVPDNRMLQVFCNIV